MRARKRLHRYYVPVGAPGSLVELDPGLPEGFPIDNLPAGELQPETPQEIDFWLEAALLIPVACPQTDSGLLPWATTT